MLKFWISTSFDLLRGASGQKFPYNTFAGVPWTQMQGFVIEMAQWITLRKISVFFSAKFLITEVKGVGVDQG